MVIGISKLNPYHEGTCKGYALGKNIKTTFHNSQTKSKEILELIHSDLCGQMSVPSLGGSLYYYICG